MLFARVVAKHISMHRVSFSSTLAHSDIRHPTTHAIPEVFVTSGILVLHHLGIFESTMKSCIDLFPFMPKG